MRSAEEGGDAALLHLVEENLRFLAELRSNGRGVARGGPLGRCVGRPVDVYELVRPEMEHLLQEQVRVVLLDTRCRVLDVVLVYQGNVSSVNFRAAEVLREAVITNALRWSSSTTTPRETPSQARPTSRSRKSS